MKTFETYQEAKIAMPKACIVKYKYGGNYRFTGMPTREGTTLCNGSEFAEPQDHCMTVKQFLENGHKFIEGDLMIDRGGLVIKVSSRPSYNKLLEDDDKRYVLRAKVLEETNTIPTETPEEKEALDATNKEDPKNGEWWFCHLSSNENNGHEKPLLKLGNYWHSSEECRVSQCYTVHPICKMIFDSPTEGKGALDSIEKTYRYEKVTFEHAWEAVKEHEESGNIFICSNEDVQNDDYPICGFDMAIIKGYLNDGSVYRRIEVTDRELELEAAYDLYIDSKQSNEPCMSKIIFISTEGREQEFWLRIVRKTGYRKLLNDVNGKG